MNTLFRKKIIAMVISGLLLGGALSSELNAQQLDKKHPEKIKSKQKVDEHKHEHSEDES